MIIRGIRFDFTGYSLIFGLISKLKDKREIWCKKWIPKKGVGYSLANAVSIREFRGDGNVRIKVEDGLGPLKPKHSENGVQIFKTAEKLTVIVEDSKKKIRTTFRVGCTGRKEELRELFVKESKEQLEVDAHDISGQQAGLDRKKRTKKGTKNFNQEKFEKDFRETRKKNVSKNNRNNRKGKSCCGDAIFAKYPFLEPKEVHQAAH